MSDTKYKLWAALPPGLFSANEIQAMTAALDGDLVARVDALETSLATCILALENSKPVDEKMADYFKKVTLDAYECLVGDEICGCGQCTPEVRHTSSCAVHRGPALEPGPCDCEILNGESVVGTQHQPRSTPPHS